MNLETTPEGLKPQARQVAGVCIVLALAVVAVFGQTAGFGFVNFDDNLYVYENAKVAGGLSLKGLAWVFTHADCSLYHPLTLLSLMGDYQLHGLHAGWYHFTNVLLHTASVILLFLILRQMTGALWRSAFVAAVFAIHPLRVESVAWVAERKDVLSAFFFMLTIGAYVRYARHPWSLAHYGLVMLLFALGLMSKPMLVTLPLVLLLLDYWPLQRVEPRKLSGLVLEKLPLVALSAASCVATLLTQTKAIHSGGSFSLLCRLGNALAACMVYLGQMVWPAGLAAFYPYALNGLPAWELALAGMLLAGLSVFAWRERRKQPWILVGWVWYLVMLLPVAGIIQVGLQAHADRYTYLPQIGIYLAVTWLVTERGEKWRLDPVVPGGLMSGVLAVLMACAWQQTAYWKNSETLWTHALGCTTGNYIARLNFGTALIDEGRLDEAILVYQKGLQTEPNNAGFHNGLGIALLEMGKVDEAIAQCREAVQIRPDYAEGCLNLGNALLQKGRVEDGISQLRKALQINPELSMAHNNLGTILLQKGSVDEAINEYQNALHIKPFSPEFHNNLGNALREKGRANEAIAQYQEALQINPDYAEALFNLGNALLQNGRMDEAVAQYQKAVQIKPDDVAIRIKLGNALLQKGKADEAVPHFQRALEISPNNARVRLNLGFCFQLLGRTGEAISQYQEALQIEPADPKVQNNLAWLLATCPEAPLRNGNKAVELARQANALTGGENPIILHTLAAAFAEAGRFSEAMETARRALRLAREQSNTGLTGALQSEIKLYQAGEPFHSPAQTH